MWKSNDDDNDVYLDRITKQNQKLSSICKIRTSQKKYKKETSNTI
jgi:hypothetical protein